MDEIGIFPLGIVLLPTEVIPLHIFEERYKELVGECIELDREFGLVYADENGVREVGTLARVAEVLERFDDGRLNVLVAGGARFRVEKVTRGRAFMTAEVEPLDDDAADVEESLLERAQEALRALAALAGTELDDPDPSSAFAIAARVELPPEAKQELLESVSETARLKQVRALLDAVREALIAAQRLGEHAKRNGSRLR